MSGNVMTDNMRGIIAMIAANACFIANDALMKLIMERLPLGESIFIRGVFTGVIFAILFRLTATPLNITSLKSRPVMWRLIAEIVASGSYLFALAGMAIGNLVGLLQIVPLAIMAGAALILKETIGVRRWTAAAVGLVGALLIIRPSVHLSPYEIMALVCIAGIVARDLITRRLPANLSSLAISATSAAGLAAFGLALGVREVWATPDQTTLLYLAFSAVFLVGANTWLITAMRTGDIGIVGPFRYTSLMWALLAGYLLWGDVPAFWAWVGMGLLVAAGIYSLRRDQLKRPNAPPPPAASTHTPST